jgi:hypothetical protein
MRELVFALEFRGRGAAVPGSATLRRARTVASSQTFRTALIADEIRAGMEPLAGETAVLESRVERFPDGSFVEDGTITYGRAGRLTFDTVGRGHVGPSPQPDRVHGTVMWRVTGGEGRLAGAQGLITSNFTVTADGEVIDDHFTRLFLPD